MTQPTSIFANLDPARQKLAYERAAERVREVRDVLPGEIKKYQDELLRRKQAKGLRDSVPPIFQPFFESHRYKGAYGGRGSSKSWSFGTMLVDKAIQQKGLRWVCIREVQKSLEQSVKRLLEDLIEKHGLGAMFRILNTHIETPGDGIIIFNGMQNHTADTIKSLEGYDGAWIEEAQSLSERSLTLLRPTLRKQGSEIWATWNPRKITDPIDQFFRGTTPPPDSVVKRVNYHDNPYLPATLLAELEWDKARDVDKYNYIWLGGYERHSEARVFKNWTTDTFDTPEDAAFLFGGDWGFAVDPTVLVRGYIDEAARTLYVDQEVYKVGCEIEDTPALFDTIESGMARKWVIVTDSARPETISHMQKHGYPRVTGAKKGAGSVEEGIQFLKNYNIVVHTRCTHVADELSMYSFKKHPLTGEIMPVLEDKKNHTIDSLRYMVETLRTPQEADFVTW